MLDKSFNIGITDNAVRRIQEITANDLRKFLRIAVDGGGCSGFQYNYLLVDKIEPEDFVIEKESIKVLIDEISQEFLNNCILDFIIELGSSYFTIKNPNATEKCGCGNSFNV